MSRNFQKHNETDEDDTIVSMNFSEIYLDYPIMKGIFFQAFEELTPVILHCICRRPKLGIFDFTERY